jgi:hypothetical protein
MLKNQLERINWLERGDNRFRKPLNEQMLSIEGLIYVENCRLATERKLGTR